MQLPTGCEPVLSFAAVCFEGCCEVSLLIHSALLWCWDKFCKWSTSAPGKGDLPLEMKLGLITG